jgi:DNA polymerase III subunit gamma/tau
MSQAFYRKWRPNTWEQVVGQNHVIHTLRNSVTAGRVAHAYLFAGPRGTGKTTTARLLAKAVNCLNPDLASRPCNMCEHCQAVNQGRFLDLIEIDAASNTSVEDVRDLRDKINFSPNQGGYKVYIVDEVHMLSTAAFNALLKTLEEPPAHAIFILATTEVHKIPATVLSRCQRHEFRRVPVIEIVSLLRNMAEGEGLLVSEEALVLVARQATGSLRDAISLLDQLTSAGDEITLELAQTVLGTAASQAVIELVEAIIKEDAATGLEHIQRTLDSGSDPRQFSRQVVDYWRNLLLIRMNNANQIEAGPETRSHMARQAQAFSTPDILGFIRSFNQAASESRHAWQPALPLEMALVEAIGRKGEDVKDGALEVRSQPKKVDEQTKSYAPVGATAPSEDSDGLPDHDKDPEAEETGGLTLALINQQWRQVLTLVRQKNPQTQGLLNSCKPLGVKNGILFLGFNSDFSRSKMEKKEHLELAQQVLEQVYEMEIPIRCIVAAGRKGSPPPDIDSDGMVAAALRDLGGEIVDVQ